MSEIEAIRKIEGWGSKNYPENHLSADEVKKVFAEMRRRGVEISVGTDGCAGDPAWLRVEIDGRLVMHQMVDGDGDEQLIRQIIA